MGQVVQTRERLYEKNLDEDRQFVQIDAAHPARSAYTVLMPWGEDGVAGSLQVQSPKYCAFPVPDQQAMEAVADMAGLAAVKLFLQRRRQSEAAGQLQPGTWSALLIDLAASTAADAVDVLDAKRQLYFGLAEEALRLTGAAATSVRLYDRASGVLRFAAYAGDVWTPEKKEILYQASERSAGMYVQRTGTSCYLPDVSKAPDDQYRDIGIGTKSLFVLPLRPHGLAIGVLSLDWLDLDGLREAMRETLDRLVNQFQNVLRALDGREQAVLQELEMSLGRGSDLELMTKHLVANIRRIFSARGCSLFLREPNSLSVRLVATTAALPATPQIYAPGEGLTGWIAQKKRPLRLRHTEDKAELERIDPDLVTTRKWSEDIRYNDATNRQSYLGVPLVREGELVGVIRLTIKMNLGEFTHEEETLLQQIADRLAIAIHTLRQAEENSNLLQRLQQQDRVNRSIEGAAGMQAVCQVLADVFMDDEGANGAYLQILDESDFRLDLAVSSGLFDGHAGEKIWSRLRLQKSRILSGDVSADPVWTPVLNWLTKTYPNSALANLQSGVYLPFEIGEETQLRGVLALVWNSTQRLESRRVERLGNLIERASRTLLPSAMQRRTEMRLDLEISAHDRLRAMGAHFAETNNSERLMLEVLEASLAEANMERGTIRLYNEDRTALVLQASVGGPAEAFAPSMKLDEVVRRSLGRASCTFIKDTASDPVWQGFRARTLRPEFRAEFTPERLTYISQMRSALDVPIRLKNECLGLIHLDSTEVRGVPDQVLTHLEILAGYAAVAIEFARIRSELEQKIEVLQPIALGGTMLSGFLHVMKNRINDLFAILGNYNNPRWTCLARRRRLTTCGSR